MRSRHLVFLGPPASGKGTQGRRLAKENSLAYLSTGALLRRALRDNTDLGQKARPYLERGEYVPDDIMVPMVLEWVSEQVDGWLLDGFPRTVPQVKALDSLLEVKPSAIILHVSDDELRRRVACRLECVECHRVAREGEGEKCPECQGSLEPRADDAAANFENRLAEYRRLVIPAVTYYCDQQRARIVNGMGSPDEVYARVKG
ncbi:MAG: nucleoside monophosphate kinase [Akkermansiaceae bacterium]